MMSRLVCQRVQKAMHFSTLLLLLILYVRFCSAADPCTGTRLIFFNAPSFNLDDNGKIMQVAGFNFREGTFGPKNASLYFGCPCMIQQCISHCSNLNKTKINKSSALLSHLVLQYSIFYNDAETEQFVRQEIEVEGDGWTATDLFKEYYVVSEAQYVNEQKFHQVEASSMSKDQLLDDRHCFLINDEKKIEFYRRVTGETQSLRIAICFGVSAVCLALLLVAFFVTHETKYLHGKSMCCHSLCLIMTFIGLILNHMNSISTRTTACFMIGYVTYYAFMSSFFWLNAICFDLYRAFSNNKLGKIRNKKTDNKKFLRYSLYAWTAPLIMTTGVLINQNCDFIKDPSFKVSLGTDLCFLDTSRDSKLISSIVFVYGPILVLLLSNFGLFLATSLNIFNNQRQIKSMPTEESATARNKRVRFRFLIYLKLFATMCGLWIMEIISWAHQSDDLVWQIFDLINSLRGLWLMIFCVLLSTRVRCKLLRVCGCPSWASVVPVGQDTTPDHVPRSRDTMRINIFENDGKITFSMVCSNKRRTV